jgi:MFS family permease
MVQNDRMAGVAIESLEQRNFGSAPSVDARMESAHPNEAAAYPPTPYAAFLLSLMIFAIVVTYLDGQIISLLIAPLKRAYGLSDAQIGLLQGTVVSLCSAIAAIPMGYLVDRVARMRLMFFILVIWGGATALSGVANSFWLLLLCRIAIGVSGAGLVPATMSLLSDLFAPHVRYRAIFIFLGLSNVVVNIGLAAGGGLVQAIDAYAYALPFGLGLWPHWRLTLLVAAVPSVLLAAIFLLQREPTRKSGERDGGPVTKRPTELRKFLRENLATLFLLCLSGASLAIGVNALVMWLPTILNREFSFPTSQAAEWLGLAFGSANLLSIFLADWLRRFTQTLWGNLAPLYLLRVSTIASTLLLPALIIMTTPSGTFVAAFFYSLFVFVSVFLQTGLVAQLVPNEIRGRIFAVAGVISMGVGSLSPISIGLLSDRLFHGGHGLRLAWFAVSFFAAMVAVFSLIRISGSMRRSFHVSTS